MKNSNENLIVSIQTGKDTDGQLMLSLYNQNIGVVNTVCNQMGIPEYLREDIKQEYFIWLSNAVNSFNLDNGNLFVSYLFPYLRGQMIRFMENQNSLHIPSYKCNEQMNYLKEKNRLTQILLREPTNQELASFMGIRLSKLINIKKELSGRKARSLNELVSEEGNELGELIPDKDNCIDNLCESLDIEYRNKELWRIMAKETDLKKETIEGYYNGTYKADNEFYYKLRKAITTLRKQPGKTRLLRELSDINYCRAKGVNAFQRDNSSIVEDLVFKKIEREGFKMGNIQYNTMALRKEVNLEYAAKDKKSLGVCSICGKTAERKMLSVKAAINYATKGTKPNNRNLIPVCNTCFLREARNNKCNFEISESGELIEYR